MDKATRERLKQKAADQKKPLPVLKPLLPPSLAPLKQISPPDPPKSKKDDKPKTPKAPKERLCCKTMGGDCPHAEDCFNHPAMKAKAKDRKAAKKQAAYVDERLPDGATFTGVYTAETTSWTITLSVRLPGDTTQVFSRSGSAHDKLFHQLAQECRKWAAKKAAESKPAEVPA